MTVKLLRHDTDEPAAQAPVHLCGAEERAADVSKLVAAHRLVTVAGPGGAGKTRLATELGWKLQSRFAGGAVFVDLAPVQSDGSIPARISAACGVPERAGRPVIDAVACHLSAAPSLLILDNCEHLIQEAGQVAHQLLQECPELMILATSRLPLEIPGEVIWRIPPLGLPSTGDPTPEQFDSVRLFAERAAARSAGYQLSDRSRAAVAEICRRLDGMPLAIELASSWVGVLGESEILDRVTRDLSLLEGRGPAVAERHRTIAAAITGSYDLLDGDARRVFDRLGVFAGSFDLAAVEAVVDEGETLRKLSDLVAHALVVAETRSGEPARYRLLETVRQFAATKLESDAGSGEVFRRHAHHFLEMAEQAESARDTPAAVAWMVRLISESDNLRKALDWLIRLEPDRGVQLAGALGWFWQATSNSEGSSWLDRAVRASPTRDWYRARACDWAGWMLINLGDFSAAQVPLREGLDISQDIGDKAGIARALTGMAPMTRMGGDKEEAFRMVEQALTLAREAGDHRIEGGALTTLGALNLDERNPDRAVMFLQEAMAVQRASGNLGGLGMSSLFYGVASLRAGDRESAVSALHESLDAFGSLSSSGPTALVLEVLAMADESLSPAQRVHLAAAGQAIIDRAGMGRPPFWEEDLKRWRAEAAAHLGARWEPAWAQGGSMTLEQAVRIAKGGATYAATPEGWDKLSRREKQVAPLIGEGLTNAQIAKRLFISERTAESHVASILSRLSFRSRSQVAAWIGTES